MRQFFRRMAALALALLALAGAACAETDGFFSEAGMFDYLRAPSALPLKPDEVAPSDGWVGTFYAEGVGLELRIRPNDTTEGAYLADLYNYNCSAGSASILLDSVLMPSDDGGLQEAFNCYALSPIEDGSFRLTFSDSFLAEMAASPTGNAVYGGGNGATLTDAYRLLANAREDRFGGAYYYDVMRDLGGGAMVYDDLTIYLSLVQLYGTGDYYLVQHREHFGQEMMDFMVFGFYLDDNGVLVHEGGINVVTGAPAVDHYTPDADGNLVGDQGSDGVTATYIRCSTKPMWRE